MGVGGSGVAVGDCVAVGGDGDALGVWLAQAPSISTSRLDSTNLYFDFMLLFSEPLVIIFLFLFRDWLARQRIILRQPFAVCQLEAWLAFRRRTMNHTSATSNRINKIGKAISITLWVVSAAL